MTIKNDIASLQVRLNRVAQRSKFGKHITDSYLNPILDNLDSGADQLLHVVGKEITAKLIHRIMSSTPSGGIYQVYNVLGRGTYQYVRDHKASAKGQPPAMFTGTLANSIDYRVSQGRLTLGIFDSPGTEARTVFYRSGKIFISNQADYTPVTVYAKILEDESSKSYSPWLKKPLQEMRDDIRYIIRTEMKKILKRATRSKYLGKAIYFRVYFEG